MLIIVMTDRRDRIKKTLDKALFVKKYTFSTVLGTLIKNIKLKMNFKYIQNWCLLSKMV